MKKYIPLLIFVIALLTPKAKAANDSLDGRWSNGNITLVVSITDPYDFYNYDSESELLSLTGEKIYGSIEGSTIGYHPIWHVSNVKNIKNEWNAQATVACPKDGSNHNFIIAMNPNTRKLTLTLVGDACWNLRGEIKPFSRIK